MKRFVTVLLAAGAFVFSAGAQETRKEKDKSHAQQPRHHYKKNRITSQLNLTAEQKEQMKANRDATKKQMMDLEKDENITVKEYKVRKAAIRKEQKEKMTSLLTAEQKEQLVKQKADKKAGFDKKREARLEKMKSTLNLSDVQLSDLKSNREAQQLKFKDIRSNEKLSEVEKKEKFKELKDQHKAEFKKILTEEQLKKWEETKKHRSTRSK